MLAITYWVVVFLTADFLWYWHHRFGHTMRLGWTFHCIHHTIERLSLISSIRIDGETTNPLHWIMKIVAAWVLGFDVFDFAFGLSLGLLYQIFVHSEKMRNYPAIIDFFS